MCSQIKLKAEKTMNETKMVMVITEKKATLQVEDCRVV